MTIHAHSNQSLRELLHLFWLFKKLQIYQLLDFLLSRHGSCNRWIVLFSVLVGLIFFTSMSSCRMAALGQFFKAAMKVRVRLYEPFLVLVLYCLKEPRNDIFVIFSPHYTLFTGHLQHDDKGLWDTRMGLLYYLCHSNHSSGSYSWIG